MILVGQYDSPFVRRVGVALRLYGMAFDHRPWSVFGDAEALRALNPLLRVPVLLLDDGTALTDSHLILDHLDGLARAPLAPRAEPARHRVLRITGLACGLAEKAVSLFYERRLHDVTSPVWEDRCRGQILSVLAALEAERGTEACWFGADMTHADIALTCAWRFAREAHPGLIDDADYPLIAAGAARCEALAVFQEISQPFLAPA
ncbi:MAG: glutathione S-transferase N-terminal domain-containing protein [Pseudomonadota bacterium]